MRDQKRIRGLFRGDGVQIPAQKNFPPLTLFRSVPIMRSNVRGEAPGRTKREKAMIREAPEASSARDGGSPAARPPRKSSEGPRLGELARKGEISPEYAARFLPSVMGSRAGISDTRRKSKQGGAAGLSARP